MFEIKELRVETTDYDFRDNFGEEIYQGEEFVVVELHPLALSRASLEAMISRANEPWPVVSERE